MKYLLIAGALAAAAIAAPANAQVSLSIGQPGFFGQLEIGNDYPAPQVIYNKPVMVAPVPVSQPPIYLRVKPNEARHWKRYCNRYNACNQRVYFVQDNWYNNTYAPRYQERHRAPPPPMARPGDNRGPGGDRRDDRYDNRRDDRHDNRRDDRH